MSNVYAIIQARTNSKRLPSKVLLDLMGKPVIERVVERVAQATTINQIIVTTSTAPEDDAIEKVLKKLNIPCFRGSEDDVLDRFYQTCHHFHITQNDIIVRITADCPLHDPHVIDNVVSAYLMGGFDYIANVDPPTYPDGLDCEVFSFEALEEAWHKATLSSEREHVTPYIRDPKRGFSMGNVPCNRDLSFHRWTLDEPADYQFIQWIYTSLYTENAPFFMEDIVQLLEENPEQLSVNGTIHRNEGYAKSLQEDREVR